jgi:predicted 3-demethylubiquinone-9 3-methyltransferase (glyoxalase superfamily)
MKHLIASAVLLAGAGLCLPREPYSAHLQQPGAHAVPEQQKITTCLWFETEAAEAARFYTSLLADSKVLGETRWGKGGLGPEGSILEVTFQLAGQRYVALNGNPGHHFQPAVSLLVHCEDQAEIDRLWQRLGEDGKPGRCGWLQDKYGLSWQIVPTVLGDLMRDRDDAKRKRVMDALLQMDKIDVARLQQAHTGA